MKKILLALFAVSIFLNVQAAPAKPSRVNFNISRSYCVLNFLETCKGTYGTSDALRQYIEDNTKGESYNEFKKLIAEYTALNLDIFYQHNGFPETRPAYRSTKDLLIMEAATSENIDQFSKRIVGILHSEDYQSFVEIIRKADAWYEKIIWAKYGSAAVRQLKNLKKYELPASEAFARLIKFYGSSWPDNVPFIVTITPVPGKINATAATPHANVLCLDVLVEETDYAARIAITLHEICHVLYAEQSRQKQLELESAFEKNKSQYAIAARNFFDEGLATANGNGWVYKLITGGLDPNNWYSNEYINGFGHALLPLTTSYLSEGKTIDNSFVESAINLFGEKFPRAPDDIGILFNHLTLHSDETEPIARNRVKQDIYQQFSIYYLNFTSPILDDESVTLLKESTGTQLIIVDRNYKETILALENLIPELKDIRYDLSENFVITFFDRVNRLIVIAKINKDETANLFKVLFEKQFVNRSEPYSRFPPSK